MVDSPAHPGGLPGS